MAVRGAHLWERLRRRRGDTARAVPSATSTVPPAGEAEYESVLAWFDQNGYVPEVMATAARMAGRRRGGISVLITIEVPAASTIDARMPEQEARAESDLEEAKLQCGSRRVTGRWEKVRAGQTGRRIIDEAKAINASAIVMPMSSDSAFGRTVKAVLRERPCRVIIESIPRNSARRRGRGKDTTTA